MKVKRFCRRKYKGRHAKGNRGATALLYTVTSRLLSESIGTADSIKKHFMDQLDCENIHSNSDSSSSDDEL